MTRLGYLNEDLLLEHEAEEKRRLKLQNEIMANWKVTAQTIKEDNADMLQREARREALTIIEDAARTAEEYDRVTILWDCVEKVEGWRIDKQVPKRTNILTESEYYHSDRIIPPPINHEWWRELMRGSFLDIIFDCPHEIQELTSNCSVYSCLKNLDESRKEILYYWTIRQWTPQRIAAMRGQSDRNIRKVYNKMIGDIRRMLTLATNRIPDKSD